MNPQGETKDTQDNLGKLLGQKLLRSRNFCATRHFYFGEPGSEVDADEPHYTLGLECPWRIQTDDLIVVGSEDYYERAENNTDQSWEPGMPSGHLQDQKLAELLGELRDGDAVNTRSKFIVESVEVDRYGGFRLGLTGGYIMQVFPSSKKRMEWIFTLPSGGSVMLMNGTLAKSSRYPTGVTDGPV